VFGAWDGDCIIKRSKVLFLLALSLMFAMLTLPAFELELALADEFEATFNVEDCCFTEEGLFAVDTTYIEVNPANANICGGSCGSLWAIIAPVCRCFAMSTCNSSSCRHA